MPTGKTLEAFDVQATAVADRNQLSARAYEIGWIEKARILLLFGPYGVGRGHLAAAICHAFNVWEIRVRYCAASGLVQQLEGVN